MTLMEWETPSVLIGLMKGFWLLQNELIAGVQFNICNYNIPRVCFLNRLPVPAMVLKGSTPGLWHHIIETCYRLRLLCHKHSNSVMRHDTLAKPTLLSCDTSFMLYMSDIVL